MASATTPIPVLDLPTRNPPSGRNRRFLPRMMGSFRVRSLQEGYSLEGIDLSFSGMMVYGEPTVWPGNVVEVELLLGPGMKPLEVKGRVVDLVSFRGEVAMRVRFESASGNTRHAIAQWMGDQSKTALAASG